MVLPRPFLAGSPPLGARVDISVRDSSKGRLWPQGFAVQPVVPAQFLPEMRGASTLHLPACPVTSAPKGMRPTCVQRPTPSQRLPMPSEPVAGPFWRPKSPLSRADKPSSRCLRLAWRSAVLRDPLGECRRDANSLAPNGSKARTLRCARQELVRVPESNTKYGGLRGLTGGKPAPVVEPSISESSGIPNRKNLHLVVPRRLHPAVHRAGIFLGNGVAEVGLT